MASLASLNTDIQRATLRPPLKWAGGKRWLVPYLRPYWEQHEHRRLVEPFCGGLAVSLGLMPERTLLNDINPHLVNFYHWVQRGLRIRIHMRNEAGTYTAHRARFNALIGSGRATTQEAAELFYYLNRTGFNGLCRFNQSGEFNVPVGRYNSITYPRDFLEYRDTLADWEFHSMDFERLPVKRNDFIYADPPYDVEFTQYAKGGFSWDDQVRLAEWLSWHHPGPVALSNQATPRVVKLYRRLGFRLRFLQAPRMISCNGDRTPAREVLALKNI